MVKAAAADAQRQGGQQLAKFKEVRKKGGEAWVTLLETYERTCASRGRGYCRGSFDYAKFSLVYSKAQVSKGAEKGGEGDMGEGRSVRGGGSITTRGRRRRRRKRRRGGGRRMPSTRRRRRRRWRRRIGGVIHYC